MSTYVLQAENLWPKMLGIRNILNFACCLILKFLNTYNILWMGNVHKQKIYLHYKWPKDNLHVFKNYMKNSIEFLKNGVIIPVTYLHKLWFSGITINSSLQIYVLPMSNNILTIITYKHFAVQNRTCHYMEKVMCQRNQAA